ncbi:ABC transporter permease [Pseudoclavibacter helvolus]|uniref:Peptide/nickel transport system permease protein n=1 Tax=Pseudoclavibacter helvolus TaxID=255205 RepID=A0A7W4UKM6_9MICO|nr:peptide/nickel transport system permease protein [Pseudoclavibacter helvolus]
MTTDARGRAARLVPLIPRILLRLGGVVFVLWAVITVTFFAVRAVPGDPVLAILGGPGSNASAEAVAQARAENGLDQPLFIQYRSQLWRTATGDLGFSYAQRESVAGLIGEQLPGTLALAGLSLLLAWVIALAVAWWSTGGGRLAWGIASTLEVIAAAVPHFWLAAVLVLVFAGMLGLPVAVSGPGFGGLILPSVTLALPLAGYLGQVMREQMLDALESPFVLAARARGEGRSGIFWRHVLRHAAIPAVGLSGWALGSLVSGAVVVETIFARPGLGRSLLDAVGARDVPYVIGVLIVVAAAYMLVTVITDLVEPLIDPRARDRAGDWAGTPGIAAMPGRSGASA